MPPKVWKPGVGQEGTTNPKEQKLSIRELRAGERGPLAPLQKHFTFFTPALIYRYGKFRNHHWFDLFQELGRELPFYRVRFAQPTLIVSDHTDPWNSVWWCCKNRHWPVIREFVLSIAQYDHDTQVLERYGIQDTSLPDPKGQGNVHLFMFGLNTSQKMVAFWHQSGLPTARTFRPRPEVVRLAQELQRGQLTADITGQPTDPLVAAAASQGEGGQQELGRSPTDGPDDGDRQAAGRPEQLVGGDGQPGNGSQRPIDGAAA